MNKEIKTNIAWRIVRCATTSVERLKDAVNFFPFYERREKYTDIAVFTGDGHNRHETAMKMLQEAGIKSESRDEYSTQDWAWLSQIKA